MRYASILLIGLGLFGLVSGCLIKGGKIPIANDYELPLANPRSIAVDSEGGIYCASSFYARIQYYDRTGTFVTGWFVESYGGTLSLRVNESDQLEVFVPRGDEVLTFDRSGRKLLSLKLSPEHVVRFNGLTTSSGDTKIAVEYPVIAPRVVRINKNGEKGVLIANTFPEWLVTGPLPAWAFYAGGLLLWSKGGRVRRTNTSKAATEC